MQGYFFELGYLLTICTLCIAAGIMLILHKEIRISPLIVLVFGLVALYGISIIYAVDREHALLEALRISCLLPFSLIVSTLKFEERLSLLRLWTWIGALLVIIGVVFHLERKERLESTIEYANSLAILLLVALMVCLFFYLKERRFAQALVLVILGTGLLLTLSRAVWVLWGIALIASFISFPEMRNRRNMMIIGFAHLGSFLVAAFIKQDLLFFWHRVKSIQPDTAELQIRTVYWSDSLLIIRDYWWGGTGGGGWRLLQHEYQSKAYFVKYVHNHYLQIAMDIGIIGLGFFLFFMIWFYIKAWKQRTNVQLSIDQKYWSKSIIILVSVILLHAGFDFDLSFPLIFGILLFLISSVMDGEFTKVHKLSGLSLVLIGGVLISISGFALIISIGYQQKELGIRSAAESHWDEAHQHFSDAKRLLPWSHTTLYEYAKSYVLQGNHSRDLQDYYAAQVELEAALKRAPLEKIYQELKKDLEKVNQ